MIRLIPIRVMVLDDEEAVCRRILGWLTDAAFDAVTFSNASAALSFAGQAACHVALIDLRMPDADGAETIAALGRIAPDTRVIAMTAFPETPQVIAAMRAGARDLLEKPIQPPTLMEAITRQLLDGGMAVRDEQEFNKRLGMRLRGLRATTNRSLGDIAECSGLTSAQLSQIELGRSGTTTWTLARIAAALNRPIADLLNT